MYQSFIFFDISVFYSSINEPSLFVLLPYLKYLNKYIENKSFTEKFTFVTIQKHLTMKLYVKKYSDLSYFENKITELNLV